MSGLVLPGGPAEPFTITTGPSKMRRQNGLTEDEVVEYNLRGGGDVFAEFEVTQWDRVAKARAVIAQIGQLLPEEQAATLVEPGCSTGDISGYFSQFGHEVIGIDVTPGAAREARRKWPRMEMIEKRIEEVEPIECDILVLCEFLEHIVDPVRFVRAWLPLARYVVIGHPLVGDGIDPEPGHPWAYYPVDFGNWFEMGGHVAKEAWTFPMGYRMILGWGERL